MATVKTKMAVLTALAFGWTSGGAMSAFSDDKLPNYLHTVSPPTLPAASPQAVAESNVLVLDKAMMPIYDSALQKFKANLLSERPVLLARFTGAGGQMILYRPGQEPITAPPPPIEYQLAKSCGHSAMAMYELTAPYLSDPSDKSWQAPMRAFLSRNKSALNTLNDLTIDADKLATLEAILTNNVSFMEACLKYDTFTYEDLEGFARRFKPLAAKVIWIGAEAQVSHWMTVLDAWQKLLGEDWDKLYAAANTIYVTRQNDILFSVLVQYMGEDAIHKRLLLFESCTFVTTKETMLDLLTRILADRVLGKVYFGNYYLMDYELLGEGARQAIQEQCKQRNMSPVLPPLVPFNSTEWPWRIDPKSGTGPATLEQTM
jgi:hypothetical protein